MDSQSNSSAPLFCARGCGFYGSAHNRNLCSKCYKDYLKELISATSESVNTLEARLAGLSLSSSAYDYQPIATADGAASSEITVLGAAGGVKGSSSDDLPGGIVKSSRCHGCKRKVGLLGFECRCGKVFCGVHRYPTEHYCTFDFKAFDRQLLVKQNPLVKGDKLDVKL